MPKRFFKFVFISFYIQNLKKYTKKANNLLIYTSKMIDFVSQESSKENREEDNFFNKRINYSYKPALQFLKI
jgi:hypothetical protein